MKKRLPRNKPTNMTIMYLELMDSFFYSPTSRSNKIVTLQSLTLSKCYEIAFIISYYEYYLLLMYRSDYHNFFIISGTHPTNDSVQSSWITPWYASAPLKQSQLRHWGYLSFMFTFKYHKPTRVARYSRIPDKCGFVSYRLARWILVMPISNVRPYSLVSEWASTVHLKVRWKKVQTW